MHNLLHRNLHFHTVANDECRLRLECEQFLDSITGLYLGACFEIFPERNECNDNDSNVEVRNFHVYK